MQRRPKPLKRQARVADSEVRKQSSEPAAAPARAPPLLKHDSYPQYAAPRGLQSHKPRSELEMSALLVRALPVLTSVSAGGSAGVGGESATAAVVSAGNAVAGSAVVSHGSAGAGSAVVSAGSAGAGSAVVSAGSAGAGSAAGGAGSGVGAGGAPLQRASHTPAVRSGPPLSCNFCWNTVDECGRILRRKTQYHCPECRTNLCIVPCFHEYHDGPESDSNTNAR